MCEISTPAYGSPLNPFVIQSTLHMIVNCTVLYCTTMYNHVLLYPMADYAICRYSTELYWSYVELRTATYNRAGTHCIALSTAIRTFPPKSDTSCH